MISLKQITEEELRRYYYLEGQISGKAKNINILNGIQLDYVGSCINNFISWNDDWNKSKLEIHIKENLPKMELEYEEKVKRAQFDEAVKQKIISMLLSMTCSLYVKNKILDKYKIPRYEYYHKVAPCFKKIYNFDTELIPINELVELVKMDKAGDKYREKLQTIQKKPGKRYRINWLAVDDIIIQQIPRDNQNIDRLRSTYSYNETKTITKNQSDLRIIKKINNNTQKITDLKKELDKEADKICVDIQNEINMLLF